LSESIGGTPFFVYIKDAVRCFPFFKPNRSENLEEEKPLFFFPHLFLIPARGRLKPDPE
jgi:hypothetical protein